ncbi:MAG TPA: Mrp/NBP35 family ATP-binding protein [Clostridia bacterium]|nr:Mrp/NBP35 family ATP-binding protein [Clostridia bacterium]
MNKECDNNCENCKSENTEKKNTKTDFSVNMHHLSSIKKVIAVVSGKGGVGKSMVTSMLAVLMKRQGYHSAVLDADITGPSIPKAFNIKGRVSGSDLGMYPLKSKTGIDIMSINLLLEHDTDPVVWRGPMLGNVVKQFWSEVIWTDIDYMFIDMPPGTSDVPLTIFQSLPVDGIIVVTSPQELVSMIVEKAVKMANMMNIPVLGIVENYSYFLCPDNNKKYKIFGESNIDEIAKQHEIKVLGKIPIDPRISTASDKGMIELFEGEWLDDAVEYLSKMED